MCHLAESFLASLDLLRLVKNPLFEVISLQDPTGPPIDDDDYFTFILLAIHSSRTFWNSPMLAVTLHSKYCLDFLSCILNTKPSSPHSLFTIAVEPCTVPPLHNNVLPTQSKSVISVKTGLSTLAA